MNVKDYLNVMEKNLKNYMLNMKMKRKEENKSKLDTYFKKLSKAKLKLELHICFIKMLAIENQTKRI
jgi:hypothetical protein